MGTTSFVRDDGHRYRGCRSCAAPILRPCQKGTCPRMATRIATYKSHAGPVQMDSCDHHGGDTVEVLEQAEEARKFNADPWIDEYDPPCEGDER